MEEQSNQNKVPTLYEWAGGVNVIEELITKFYEM